MSESIEIRTSDLARYILRQEAPDKLPDADEDHLIFGKIFEEVYTECTWLHSKSSGNVDGNSFRRKLAAKVKSSDISDERSGYFISKGYKMFACLLSEEVTGRKPKSEFREIEEGRKKVRLYAQPDLIEGGEYSEFKTGPIDDYAILQSKIFYWVIQKSITLVGLSEDNRGYIEAEKRVIDECDIEVDDEVFEYVESEV